MLVTADRGRRVIVAACDEGRAYGVHPGMTLAEGQAFCPNLTHVDHEPERDRRGLAALGRWLMRFTPAVAVELPDALFLDVTGCERLFRGFDVLLAQATAAVASLGLSARLAIAPTPGAAWALAGTGRVFAKADVTMALAPLPPAALRINPAVADALRSVGIDTIGQLSALPRPLLPARFGHELLRRLDQATGRVAEPLVLLDAPVPVRAALVFDGVVFSLEAIEAVLRELLGRVADDLTRRGCGARQVRATFWCEGELPVVRNVRLCLASRDEDQLFDLLRCATEDVKATDGFTAVEVAVPTFERMTEGQRRLIGHDPHDSDVEVGRLIERLRVRLSDDAVRAVRLVESHLPERAYASGPAGDDPRDNGVVRSASLPLRLLPRPVEVLAVVEPSDDAEDARPAQIVHAGITHRLAHAAGPRRVAGVWWTGHDKTRDYFDVLTQGGQRMWVFRVVRTRRWFLHGVFA